MVFSALFGIVVGLAMIGQWLFLYLSKNIPELKDEPIRISFHMAAEIITALCLIISGIGLLAGLGWSKNLFLVSLGMLFYTAIVSPGYFAQKGDWKWLGMFATLIAAGLVSLFSII